MRLVGDTSAITAAGQFVNIQLAGKYLRRNGYLDKPTLKSAIPAAVLAAAAGAWLATAIDVELLRRPFGIYLLFSGISLIWPKKKP